MTLCLRKARSTDAGAVGAILSQFIDETPWMPRLYTRAEDLAHAGRMIANGWVTVAENTQGVQGFVARDGCEIHSLYIATSAHRKGIGTCLLDGEKAHCDILYLWTFQNNLGAQSFYKAAGFTEIERTDGAGNDEALPDIRLKWTRKGT